MHCEMRQYLCYDDGLIDWRRRRRSYNLELDRLSPGDLCTNVQADDERIASDDTLFYMLFVNVTQYSCCFIRKTLDIPFFRRDEAVHMRLESSSIWLSGGCATSFACLNIDIATS